MNIPVSGEDRIREARSTDFPPAPRWGRNRSQQLSEQPHCGCFYGRAIIYTNMISLQSRGSEVQSCPV
jgi:hypothetical protein